MQKKKSRKNLLELLELNKPIDIGSLILSEDDIMEFAKANDPLEFHLNKKAAKESIFKGLVASGPQVFMTLHKTGWIPVFGHTVICGLEVNNWKFLLPIYAGQPVKGTATPTFIKINKEKKQAVVVWTYEFTNERAEVVQTLETVLLHKL